MAGLGTSRQHKRAGAAARALLDLDPELGRLLTPERRATAERELRVRVTGFPIGEWDAERLAEADPSHLGLLVVEGVLAREVVLADTVSTELLGPGDIVRPWQIEGPPQLLAVTTRWNALADVRLALIDRRLAAQLGAFPEIGAVIVDRMSERTHRLATTQAISQLTRVDRRLVALFWHLAERWGRVAPDGIAVPLVLSHRLLGELVGARRPTVSAALADLARERQLVRRDDGTWMLTGEPLTFVPDVAAELVRQRRRLLPRAPEPRQDADPPAPLRIEAMRRAFAAAREASLERALDVETLRAETAELRARTLELRAQRARHLAALRDAAGAGAS